MISQALNEDGSVWNVSIPGDILSTNIESIQREMFDLLGSAAIKDTKWALLKLDLTKAQMIDSTGLNFIVAVVKEVKARSSQMEAVIASPKIQRLFGFVRLDRKIKVTFQPA